MITVTDLAKMKANGEKITMLTCYDASFANVLSRAGVEVLLVGDSLAMTIQGQKTTLSASLDDMCYHTAAVARGNLNSLIVADMPFGSYETSSEQAFQAACRLMKAGAHMVKFEGGAAMAATTAFLQARGIPVCAHIGLTPQAVNALGGYKVQGRGAAAEKLMQDAQAHAQAHADLLVMECVPAPLAKTITATITTPTIGIGAGVDCDGQVLVLQDMLGIFPGKMARFVKNFMQGAESIEAAIVAYVQAVKKQTFPGEEHSFLS